MKPTLSLSTPKGFYMKLHKAIVQCSYVIFISLFLSSCVSDTKEQDVQLPVSPPAPVEHVEKQIQLPVAYQRPSYMVSRNNAEGLDDIVEDVALKVGASIRSTKGPLPLRDVLKGLANLKKMNVSWTSDVDQDVLVDVDIRPNDDFYNAIDNLLRQVDYYHEMIGSTIVVRYKETRQFHIAMPFLKQMYKTNVGGDVLGGSSDLKTTNVAGEISLASDGVAINKTSDGTPGMIEFNTWASIENNLNAILNVWTTDEVKAGKESATGQTNFKHPKSENKNERDFQTDSKHNTTAQQATFRRSADANTYFIDKPIGLVTVTAPRPLLAKVEKYFNSLKRELYKQVSIEAKIIEVQLDDRSSIGLNWNLLLKNLTMSSASSSFGKNRSKTTTESSTGTDNTWNNFSGNYPVKFGGDGTTVTTAATILTNGVTEGYGSLISLAAFSFDTFLNAVKEQGQATILSNPKLSVLNGQPALITVGRNVTYIDSIESDVNDQTGTISYTVNTERVLSGVGMALTANILNDQEVILNLVPVISELVEPIEYRVVGLGEVGLPIINVREMSTTVKIKDGEMLVIGGLISNVDDEDGTFIPGTSKIPFFKYFFGYEEKISKKRELIILLRPRIL